MVDPAIVWKIFTHSGETCLIWIEPHRATRVRNHVKWLPPIAGLHYCSVHFGNHTYGCFVQLGLIILTSVTKGTQVSFLLIIRLLSLAVLKMTLHCAVETIVHSMMCLASIFVKRNQLGDVVSYMQLRNWVCIVRFRSLLVSLCFLMFCLIN